jgi:hypothetical protein
MSKSIGQSYTSLVPSFSDDASIEEAFSMYHYGIENWQPGQQISQNSIEGAFVSVNQRVDNVESQIQTISGNFVLTISPTASPNTITPQSASTTPLTIKGVASQTANLQEWKNSSNSNVLVVSPSGSVASSGYLSVGSSVLPSTTAMSVVLANSSHKGIVVRSASSQTGNLQEWQNSSGNAVSYIDNNGVLITTTSNLSKSSSFTLALTDAGKLIIMNSSSTQTITIPLNSSVNFLIGTKIDFVQYGLGEIVFSPTSGVILSSSSNKRKINVRYSAASLVKIGTDEWILVGALSL